MVSFQDSSVGSGESREVTVARLASDMVARIPPYYEPHEVQMYLKNMGTLNSMVIFLRQEIDRMQKVNQFTFTSTLEQCASILCTFYSIDFSACSRILVRSTVGHRRYNYNE